MMAFVNGGGDHHAQQHLQQHRQRQHKRQQQGQGGEIMDEPGDDHIIELEDDDDDDDDYDDDIDGGSGGDSYDDPIPAVKPYSDNGRRGKDNNNSSNGLSSGSSNKHRSAGNTRLITKTAGEMRRDAANNSRNNNGGSMNGGGMMGGGWDHHQAAVEMSLNQKNHRMAKELSDLRVRHREETRVVSRLTMENMNLASRCREAISQVASLRKEMLVHQKRQTEFVTLQKEVEMLRKLVGNNKPSSMMTATSPSSNIRHITSITNGLEEEEDRGHSSTSTSNTPNVKQSQISTTSSTKPVSPDGEAVTRSDSPATDLDRIMSQQFRKNDSPQSSLLSPTSISSATTTSKGGWTSTNSSSSAISSRTVSSTAAPKQPRPAAVAAANKGSNNLLLTSSNVKIPISVTSSVNSMSTSASANTTVTSQQQQPKDDEFDADIDMVDFFAKSQSTLLSTNINGTSKNHTGVVGGRTHHNILLNSNKPRFGTDDIMPDDVIPISSAGVAVGGVTGSGGIKGTGIPSSSSSMVTGVGMGDTLLSSLDAFEASFASAFPETSFSITTNDIAPLSTAKLDMSFDVPDFDPFFKSPSSSVNNTTSAGKSKAETVSGAAAARGGSVTGSGDCTALTGRGGGSKNNGGSSTTTTNKSQMIHDLFPESAMNFSIAKLDNLAFDASPMMSFEPMERTTSATPLLSSSQSKRGGIGGNNRSYQSRLASPLSPQSMSAEIEQLDAIADLASSISGSGCGVDGGGSMSSDVAMGAPGVNSSKANIRSSVRKVKQPVSYAEPSTKAKLRRGDVLFPKMESSDKVGKAPGGGIQMTSTTELDQIMGQIASLPSPSSSSSQPLPLSET